MKTIDDVAHDAVADLRRALAPTSPPTWHRPSWHRPVFRFTAIGVVAALIVGLAVLALHRPVHVDRPASVPTSTHYAATGLSSDYPLTFAIKNTDAPYVDDANSAVFVDPADPFGPHGYYATKNPMTESEWTSQHQAIEGIPGAVSRAVTINGSPGFIVRPNDDRWPFDSVQWFVDGDTFVHIDARIGTSDADIVAMASAVSVAGTAISSTFPGVSAVKSDGYLGLTPPFLDAPGTAVILYRDPVQPSRWLTLATAKDAGQLAMAWVHGATRTSVGGREAFLQLSRCSVDCAATGAITRSVTWAAADGLLVTVTMSDVDVSRLLEVAESVRPVSDKQWRSMVSSTAKVAASMTRNTVLATATSVAPDADGSAITVAASDESVSPGGNADATSVAPSPIDATSIAPVATDPAVTSTPDFEG